MCDETFNELTEEALRLAKNHTIVTRKKKEFTHVGEEVKALKKNLDARITERSTSRRLAASQL